MKKIVVMLLLIIVLTGCTVVRIDTANIDTIINVILSKDNTLYNKIGKGYKYYLPRGVSHIDTNEFNEKLYSEGNYYYLYIDVVSYYHKSELEYEKEQNLYYNKEIDINDKRGYVKIKEQDSKYYITFVYNYAKIESLVNKDDISNAIKDASYILSTIKFNNNVIDIMLKEDYFTNKEEKYDLFEKVKKEENSGNFLEYDK